ncbi:helix-turn-helix transcriptional regulator [Histidinibacterium lentulum]|uniref:HTH domain-containing protein n=1 Tax=Histidinibacterium lentulum TaxID=2480588 RepID=A0A3N2QM23_9RHOB|nr:HTH domain-containing protein [Histidinibacterium lentulum]ROT96115.1 HTH domain-containing protein [Histidinibacterium lentulum]
MSRADRLSDLMRALRRPGPHRAEALAGALGVSPRTIYRDMDALREAGVPVSGTRGTGYRITATRSLPPLHLTDDEMEALQVGLAAVAQAADPDLAAAAARLSEKLDEALPEDGLAPRPADAATRALRHLPTLRGAIRARQKLRLDGRVVRPLRLEFWGRLWTLLVWDETAGAFAELQVDRIGALEGLPSLFVDEAGRRARDYPG